MGREWVICKHCGKTIEVGFRCIHLFCEHRISPPYEWLKERNLKREDTEEILKAFMKGDKPNHDMKWIKENFHQDPRS